VKNNLWSFGCSFTESMKERMKWYLPQFGPETYKIPNVLEKMYGKENIKNYQDYLSEDWNLNNLNFGKGGNSNYHVFNDICNNCQSINENDIVILEWTMLQRHGFPIDVHDPNNLVSCRADNYKQFEDLSEKSLSTITFYRENKVYYINEILGYINIIRELSKLKKFKLFMWTIEDKIINHVIENNLLSDDWLFHDEITSYKSYIDFFKKNGVSTLTEETGYVDKHFGVHGHKRQYELIKKYIDENFSYR